MPYENKAQPNWWLRSWYCDVCKVTIRRHHRSVHMKSKMHTRLAKEQPSYEFLPSDIDFQRFLASFDARDLRGYEKQLYKRYQSIDSTIIPLVR